MSGMIPYLTLALILAGVAVHFRFSYCMNKASRQRDAMVLNALKLHSTHVWSLGDYQSFCLSYQRVTLQEHAWALLTGQSPLEIYYFNTVLL